MQSKICIRTFGLSFLALFLVGCDDPLGSPSPMSTATSLSSTANSLTSTPTSTTTGLPSGPRGVKIIFKQSTQDGSFDAAPSGGTPNAAGSGHTASRVFTPGGSLLATSPSATNWPKWLTSVELGISGFKNSASTTDTCANFASVAEASASTCNFGAGAGTASCGASAGLYRVSEYDCTQTGTTSDGAGSGNDGVYIRVNLSRDTSALGATENLLATLEYAASSLNPTPIQPTTCFSGGIFSPELCSDVTWRIFHKHSSTETVQPYLLLVPPFFGFVDTTKQTGGAGVSTKQWIIPLASDPTLSVVQLSRIKAQLPNPTKLISTCSNGGVGNSPLCLGVIFYSLTLIRI